MWLLPSIVNTKILISAALTLQQAVTLALHRLPWSLNYMLIKINVSQLFCSHVHLSFGASHSQWLFFSPSLYQGTDIGTLTFAQMTRPWRRAWPSPAKWRVRSRSRAAIGWRNRRRRGWGGASSVSPLTSQWKRLWLCSSQKEMNEQSTNCLQDKRLLLWSHFDFFHK